MANDAYKARARRLAAHLKAKHNLSISHSAALEAIAAEEGVRDWNTLAAKGAEADSIRLAIEANVSHRFALGVPEDGVSALPVFPLAPAIKGRPAEGKSVFTSHADLRGRQEAWPGKLRKHGSEVVEVNQSLWDYVDVTSRVRHATARVASAVAECVQRRRDDCARGAETGRLSATLLQKEALGLVRGAELVFQALDFPAPVWREACGQIGGVVREAASDLDEDWRETDRRRWAARPADLKL